MAPLSHGQEGQNEVFACPTFAAHPAEYVADGLVEHRPAGVSTRKCAVALILVGMCHRHAEHHTGFGANVGPNQAAWW